MAKKKKKKKPTEPIRLCAGSRRFKLLELETVWRGDYVKQVMCIGNMESNYEGQ